MTNSHYSTKKIEKAINYQFFPIKDSILKYCDWFLKDLVNK